MLKSNGGGWIQVVDAEAEEWWSVEANGDWRGWVVDVSSGHQG